MPTVYIRVRLKPPASVKSTAPVPVVTKVKGRKVMTPGVAAANIPHPTPEVVVRTVAADSLGHACQLGEQMPDVLAVLETSVKPLT